MIRPAVLRLAPVAAEAEESASSRRDALLAGAAVAVAGTAPAEAAEAEVFEIPVEQQCLECAGSGVVSCAPQSPFAQLAALRAEAPCGSLAHGQHHYVCCTRHNAWHEDQMGWPGA